MGNLLAINGQVINSQEPLPIPVELMTKLWENPNTSAATFSPQTITLSSDDYDLLLWVHTQGSTITQKGQAYAQLCATIANSNTIGTRRRSVERLTDTSFSVRDNYYCYRSSGSDHYELSNDGNMPLAVYGIKKQVPMQDGGAARGSVIIYADGVKTYAQLMTDLYNMLDHSLISERTVFVMTGTDNVKSYGHLGYNSYDYTVKKYIFVAINGSANGLGASVFSVAADSANSGRFNTNVAASGNTVTNSSNAVPGVGYSFKIIY